MKIPDAFGDGINDIEMIQFKPLNMALRWEMPLRKLKKWLLMLTDTVDNNGIAKAFEKYFDIRIEM